ncbi:hypothetical protein [Persephonella sp.]|nr:hypothetical protein [Aquificota bacterium]
MDTLVLILAIITGLVLLLSFGTMAFLTVKDYFANSHRKNTPAGKSSESL